MATFHMTKSNSKRISLSDARHQAAWFERVRQAHETETAEDYVELIADLIAAKGEARVVDLSQRFGVSHTTVNKVIGRLKREGLVTSEPYRALFLTTLGQKMAARCKARHELVIAFLRHIGVGEKAAAMDAEGLEHHLSEETLLAFARMISKGS